MKNAIHLGRIVCTYNDYTITEVIEDKGEGVQLAGFSVFGRGARARVVYATPEEAMQAVDELRARRED
jgi:hypothetical protein